MFPARHLRQRHWAMGPVLALVFALLLAQTLGFVHRVAHGHSGMGPVPHATTHATTHAIAVDAAGDSRGQVAGLFHHQESDPTCRLFDQSSNLDTLHSVPPVALPIVLPAFIRPFFQGEVLARWVALFDARGPPSFR